MRIYEEQTRIPLPVESDQFLSHIAAHLGENLPADVMPLRFAATRTCKAHIDCEVGVLKGLAHDHPARSRSIMDFRRRTHENCERFTSVLVVPTGIDADIGGHAGDAGPVARLIAAASDRLITHPNVVNGADINEMPENTLYVEGSVLTRLMMGTAGLAPTRANRRPAAHSGASRGLHLAHAHQCCVRGLRLRRLSLPFGCAASYRSRDDAAHLANLGARNGQHRGFRHAL